MSHINKVIDDDPHFEIDINTRNIRNVSQTKISLVQYDHNSERFSFTLPRFVEGHDMLECNSVQVHYFSSANPETKGVYAVNDLAACKEDAENVCCTWLISQNVTQTAGVIQFMLRFACVAEDGTIEYAWHTNIFTGVSVSAGMNNGEEILEQYADVLEQLKKDVLDGKVDKADAFGLAAFNRNRIGNKYWYEILIQDSITGSSHKCTIPAYISDLTNDVGCIQEWQTDQAYNVGDKVRYCFVDGIQDFNFPIEVMSICTRSHTSFAPEELLEENYWAFIPFIRSIFSDVSRALTYGDKIVTAEHIAEEIEHLTTQIDGIETLLGGI